MDEVVLGRKGPMGVCDILPVGGEEDVESARFTGVLDIDRDCQRCRMESAASALEEISSKGNRESRSEPTIRGAPNTHGDPATHVE